MNDTLLHLPYCGTLSHDQPFQYLLQKLTPQSALITVTSWLDHSLYSKEQKRVQLHLEGWLAKMGCSTWNSIGIASQIDSPSSAETLYRVQFETPLEGWQLFQKSEWEERTSQEMMQMIVARVKDSLLLKGAIQVYFRHFIPFLSRIIFIKFKTFYPKREFILEQAVAKIQQNIDALEQIFHTLSSLHSEERFYCEIDLDKMREICKSEIDSLLLKMAFGRGEDWNKFLEEEPQNRRTFKTHLDSIKIAEYRLYRNLNDMTRIYSLHLKNLTHEYLFN